MVYITRDGKYVTKRYVAVVNGQEVAETQAYSVSQYQGLKYMQDHRIGGVLEVFVRIKEV